MNKPICYIPEGLIHFYKLPSVLQHPFRDKQTAIKSILSIYLEYQCLPTEHNDMEPHDPNGLGIFEMICLKLSMMPKHARKMRCMYMQLPEIYEKVVEKHQNIISVMDEAFSLEELADYGL